MSLREYILRRQAALRDTVERIKTQTLPVVNALQEKTITVSDFFDTRSGSGGSEELRAFRYEVATKTDVIDDWSLVDPTLNTSPNDAQQDV